MLQVTEAAESVFSQVIERDDVTGGAIRILSASGPDGQSALSFQVVDEPRPGDTPAGSPGIHIYVAPELAEPLGSARLDARESEGGPELFLTEQTG